MGPLGWQETVFIFILALLVFGPRKLPELGKTLGKAMTEFRRASSELKATWSREMEAIEREGASIREETRKIGNEISSTYDHDQYNYGNEHEYQYEDSYDYGTRGSDSSSPNESSTVSASASPGAESTANDSAAGKAPEGTVPAASSTPAVAETAAEGRRDGGEPPQPASESEAVKA